jgi:hypothetical protein
LADSSRINATLLQADYLSTHRFTWTEFEIDADNRSLLVTTWGIDAYSEDEMVAEPGRIEGLVPEIVVQFRLMPIPEPGTSVLLMTALMWSVACYRRRCWGRVPNQEVDQGPQRRGRACRTGRETVRQAVCVLSRGEEFVKSSGNRSDSPPRALRCRPRVISWPARYRVDGLVNDSVFSLTV